MSEDHKDMVEEMVASILLLLVLVILFLGVPVLMGMYLQPWILIGLGLLYMCILVALPTDDTDALAMLFKIGFVFWSVVGVTYYISTGQTFIGDFWHEHKHWFIR